MWDTRAPAQPAVMAALHGIRCGATPLTQTQDLTGKDLAHLQPALQLLEAGMRGRPHWPHQDTVISLGYLDPGFACYGRKLRARLPPHRHQAVMTTAQ